MNMALEVRNYSFAYRLPNGTEKTALCKVDFAVEKGAIIGVIGLSGCGKSTLCRALAGLIPHCFTGREQGEILVAGEERAGLPLSLLSQKVGLVMQNPDDQLIATTVEDEFAFALENLAVPPEEIIMRVDEMLSLLELSSFRNRDPNHLSGGQKQLTAIGSILILRPAILVLDEPFSHLDGAGKKTLSAMLRGLANDGKTILLVSHDPSDLFIADRWLVLEEGRVCAFASPDSILTGNSGSFPATTAKIFGMAV